MTKTPAQDAVLVVEDDLALLKMFTATLEHAGYRVVGAHCCCNALEAMQTEKVDLAVLDQLLPDRSGVELGRMLNREYSVPFVLVTGSTDEQLISEATSAGALTYLVKPVANEQLTSAVKTALVRGREMGKLLRSVHVLSDDFDKKKLISTAVGVIMERFRITETDAFEILRDYARSHRQPLNDASADIVNSKVGLELHAVVRNYLARRT